MRKIVLSVLGLVLIVGAIFLAKNIVDNKKTPKRKPEKVVKTVFSSVVENGLVPIVVPANGNLKAKKRVEIYAEVQGVFKSGNKLFKEGQAYSQGENIIRSAKSNLYNQLAAIMPDLRLDYPDIFPKWKSYLDGFDITKGTPEIPEMTTDKENFFISGRGILTTYYNVKNLEQRLYKYRIAAPFKGVLAEALVTEGTLVRAGQKLGEFINTEDYELEVSIAKTYSDLLKIGAKVKLNNLNNTEEYIGEVARVNARVDITSQTIKAFITVKDNRLKEGMYLEANLDAKQEADAIEIDRNLLQENDKIFVIRDTILDLIDVNPVYFNDKSVVIKDVPDGTVIMAKPVAGAYTGMAVKIFEEQSANK